LALTHFPSPLTGWGEDVITPFDPPLLNPLPPRESNFYGVSKGNGKTRGGFDKLDQKEIIGE